MDSWRAVHWLLSLGVGILASGSRIVRSMATWSRLGKKRPRSVAVVVDAEDARRTGRCEKMAEILVFLAAFGVRYVALYDAQGILKRSGAAIEESLAFRLSTRKISLEKPLKNRKLNGYNANGVETEEMVVELLSTEDGKGAIAQSAQTILSRLRSLSRSQQLDALNRLSEKEVDDYVCATGHQRRPDPELLFVFGRQNCLQDFPPWRIRTTEIAYMGPLENAKLSSLRATLHDFSHRTQRHGR